MEIVINEGTAILALLLTSLAQLIVLYQIWREQRREHGGPRRT